jgi:hypothetical protein
MNTFDTIIQKIINKSNLIYPIEDKKNSFIFWSEIHKNNELNDASYSFKYFFYIFITTNTGENKFQFLNKILSNIFLNEGNKEKVVEIFFKIQKTYHAFSKIANIYRFKKSKLQINHDLYLNPITTQKYTTILQNGKKYMFTATDLINIINTALSNAPHFFVEPLIAKNPYNNMPFNKSTLYNIYFFLRKTDYKMPILIEKYFLANFDITLFYFENESIIRDIAIQNFVFKSDTKVLYPSVINMIHKYDTKNILTISEDFPKDKLVNIMRPYLHLYYTTKYSFMFNKKENAYAELVYKFKQFIKFNPKFGRKYILNNQFTKKADISFEENHINFYNIKKHNYKDSHLVVNMENEYNNYDTDSDSDDAPIFNIAINAPLSNINTSVYRAPIGSIINSFSSEIDRTIIYFDSSNIQYPSWYHPTNNDEESISNEEAENIIISEQSVIDDMQNFTNNDNETVIDSDDEIVIENDDDYDGNDDDDYLHDDTSLD